MCGIAGLHKKGPLTAEDVSAVLSMMDAQKHRGPDDWGVLLPKAAMARPEIAAALAGSDPAHIQTYTHPSRNELILGSRRLAILDLSPAGRMPMPSRSCDIFIIQNGEIYNYRQVREGLKGKGRIFLSDSDTEVILAGYERWGDSVVNHLRGMFGFAIADFRGESPRLLLARDRLGIKPIYYSERDDSFSFASEYRALRRSTGDEEKASTSAIVSFLEVGSIVLPRTTDEKIFAVPAGSTATFSIPQGLYCDAYWRLADHSAEAPMDGRDLSSYGTTIRTTLADAVECHLVSDVPLGVFLSGGVDSSAIVALAGRSRKARLTTISVIFEESDFTERQFAKLIAEKYNTDHREISLSAKDFYDHLDDMLAAMDQPTVDGVNTYVVSGAAKKAGVKVVLSGAGGDELFLGYDFFKSIGRIGNLARFGSHFPASVRDLFIKAGISIGRSAGIKSIGRLEYLRKPSELYLLFRGLFSPREIQRLVGLSQVELDRIDFARQELRLESQGDLLDEISELDFKHYLGDQLLKDCDFMSMAHSIETRLPFLDHVLVEEVSKVPAALRLSKNHVPKPLLLAAMGDDIPEAVWKRPKMGFTLPFARWLQAKGDELETRSLQSKVLDPQAVSEIWNSFRRGESHWSRPWAILVLSEWLSRRRTVSA